MFVMLLFLCALNLTIYSVNLIKRTQCYLDVPTKEGRNPVLTSFLVDVSFSFFKLISSGVSFTVYIEQYEINSTKIQLIFITYCNCAHHQQVETHILPYKGLLYSTVFFNALSLVWFSLFLLNSPVMTLLESSVPVTENCPEDRANSMSMR